MLAISEIESTLMFVLETHLLGTLATVKLYERSTSTSTIARVISLTKLVEFSNDMLQILSIIVSEDDCKLFLHLLEEDQSSEE